MGKLTGLKAITAKGKKMAIKEGDIIQIFLLDEKRNEIFRGVRLVEYRPEVMSFVLVRRPETVTYETIESLTRQYPTTRIISYRHLGTLAKNPEELWSDDQEITLNAPVVKKESLLDKIKNWFK